MGFPRIFSATRNLRSRTLNHMEMRTSKTKFNVLSPDGIPIQPYPFPSKEAAEIGAKVWAERYIAQGFYSSASFGRIPLEEIPRYWIIEPC